MFIAGNASAQLSLEQPFKPLQPFVAEYTVYKNGQQIGQSSTELSYDAPYYRLTDSTNGTHGMASFLGFKRTEVTVFNVVDSVFYPQSYNIYQKIAFNKRTAEFKLDPEKQTITGTYKDKGWQIPAPALFSTPNLVSLNLFHDICAGLSDDLHYTVIKDNKVTDYAFTTTTTAEGLIEVNKIHSNPNTITKSWLDPNQQCLPVKTYHVEADEDAIETKLTKFW